MHGPSIQRTDGSRSVSVAMTAYNSERWIGRAIESVFRQQTEFPVEIVVGDDCSPDGTASVVEGYRARYPDRLRVLARSQNLGMQRNFYDVFEHCRGRYVAWLDADDWWTDPEKLTLQVEALESDPSLSICGHFVRFVQSSGEVMDTRYPHRRAGRYGLKDIIRQNFVPSLSIMFRRGLHRELPGWYFDLSGVADWPLLLAGARTGDILLLDRVMANYYKAPGSAYSSKDVLAQYALDLEVRERMESMLSPQWRRHVQAGIGAHYEALAYHFRMEGDVAGARRAALKAFWTPALLDNGQSKVKTLAAALLGGAATRVRRRSSAT